jgi:hypothetical protein
MIMELPEENLRYFTSRDNLMHLQELIKNAYDVRKENINININNIISIRISISIIKTILFYLILS